MHAPGKPRRKHSRHPTNNKKIRSKITTKTRTVAPPTSAEDKNDEPPPCPPEEGEEEERSPGIRAVAARTTVANTLRSTGAPASLCPQAAVAAGEEREEEEEEEPIIANARRLFLWPMSLRVSLALLSRDLTRLRPVVQGWLVVVEEVVKTKQNTEHKQTTVDCGRPRVHACDGVTSRLVVLPQ